jgi:hypothetical protein
LAGIFIALTHFPVYNKHGEVITSALTTIDLHDLARVAACYGAAGFFVVTPLEDQQRLAEKMIAHWRDGWGYRYNPHRSQAMGLIRLIRELDEAKREIAREYGAAPLMVGTSAVDNGNRLSFSELRKKIGDDRPVMLIFGTAWGLTSEAINECDHCLAPISGRTGYNHLSVRAAAGIIMDRLLGER